MQEANQISKFWGFNEEPGSPFTVVYETPEKEMPAKSNGFSTLLFEENTPLTNQCYALVKKAPRYLKISAHEGVKLF